MTDAADALRASYRGLRRFAPLLMATLILATTLGAPAPAAAATATAKVAVIVGPAGSATAGYRAIGLAAADHARRYTSNVVTVMSPNATWTNVRAAMTGASLVIFVGRGSGTAALAANVDRAHADGFGLNPNAGVDDSSVAWYGEQYMASVRLAPNALVVLSHVPCASGRGAPGMPRPSLSTVHRRIDNYGSGFLRAGAAAVVAELSASAAWWVDALFTRDTTLDTLWSSAPAAGGATSSFASARLPGARGRVQPTNRSPRFSRSIVGWTTTRTTAVRAAAAGVIVPATIDSSGAHDVSGALNALLWTLPAGSTLIFRSGGVYRLDHAIFLDSFSNLVFDGGGATLRVNGCTAKNSGFMLGGTDRITIRNFTIVGNNARAGTKSAFQASCELQAGIALFHATNTEIDHVAIRSVHGDCLYVDQWNGAWSDHVWFHDSSCRLTGRQGVAITAGSNVTVERVTFDKVAMHVFDIEAWQSTGGGTNVTLRSNQIGSFSVSSAYQGFFFAANGVAGSTVRDVAVTGNTVRGGPLRVTVEIPRRRNIQVTGNVSTVRAAGPIMYFLHVDGVMATGNSQPLSSGSLVRALDCTNAVYP